MAVKLSFGTAGIRAPLGEGDAELNLRTVRVIAHALVSYAAEVIPAARTRGLCVGFDGRRQSDAFAREVCAVALAQGFQVRAFETPVPTPLLSFCTRDLGAALGVMITASHNPPTDNGIKVYWQGGAQIVPPHDREIALRIAQEIEPESIARAALAEARQSGQLSPLGERERTRYLEAVTALVPPSRELALPPIAYSALFGVGAETTRALLERAAIRGVMEVEAQSVPQPDLGGLASPNPEHQAALAELLALAERERAAIALCHDPDADRLAVAVRDAGGSLRVLSGDDVGALLGDFLLSLEPAPSRTLLLSTLVSAELLQQLCEARGSRYEQTLTGFKWIARRARELEQTTGLHYLFGYEEALGYAFGALGDDKDGIAAMHVLLELARRLHARGESLLDRLEALARAHGLFATRQLTLSAAGEQGKAHVDAVIRALRANAPESWLGTGASGVDYLTRPERADLLVFRTPGARICVRPSGTEPKLKLYLQVREPVQAGEVLAAAELRAQAALSALEARVRQVTG